MRALAGVCAITLLLSGCVLPEPVPVNPAPVSVSPSPVFVDPGSLSVGPAPVAGNPGSLPVNPAPVTVRNVSPAALAALPRGMHPGFLVKDVNGCYGIAVEQSEPIRGVPLRNAAGQQVCDT